MQELGLHWVTSHILFFLWFGWVRGLDCITPGVCVFLVGMWGAGDIEEFWQEAHGIERCMGTQRLPNITSMSIRRPPAHEKDARATFFPYGAGAPEQLFSPTGKINFSYEKTNVLDRFGDRFWVLFGHIWGCCLARFVVCGCGCVCVCLSV